MTSLPPPSGAALGREERLAPEVFLTRHGWAGYVPVPAASVQPGYGAAAVSEPWKQAGPGVQPELIGDNFAHA